MNEIVTIGIAALAFCAGLAVSRFSSESRISQAYEDGLYDGSGNAYLKENQRWEKSSS